MAAIDTVNDFGRITPYGNVAVIIFTINANSAVYATASGGLPIDLTAPLTQGAPFSLPNLNPGDVVGLMQIAVPSTNGYFPYALVPGTPVFSTPTTGPFATANVVSSNVRPDVVLTAFPATVRLYTKAGVEVADGANTDTSITIALIVARGGSNS